MAYQHLENETACGVDDPGLPESQRDKESGPSRTNALKACDECHRLKIKCDQGDPCRQCTKASRNCTYLKPRKRKGPVPKSKGDREGEGETRTAVRTSLEATSLAPVPDSALPFPVASTSAAAHESNYVWPFQLGDNQSGQEDAAVSSFWNALLSGDDGSAEGSAGTWFHAPPLVEGNYPSPWGFNEGGERPFYSEEGASTVTNRDQVSSNLQLETSRSQPSADPSAIPPNLRSFEFRAPPPIVAPRPSIPPPSSWMSVLVDLAIIPQIDIYFSRLHEIMPILSRDYITGRIANKDYDTSPDFAALLLSIAALSLLQPIRAEENFQWSQRDGQAQRFLTEACKLKGAVECGENVSFDGVLSSFLLFLCLFSLRRHDAAWFRIREAITLAELMDLHHFEQHVELEPEEKQRRQRLCAILAVTERGYAIQRRHTITFKNRPGSPKVYLSPYSILPDPESTDPVVFGLQCLVRLFSLVDEDVVSCWNRRCTGGAQCSLTIEKIKTLQSSLREDVFGWAAPSLEVESPTTLLTDIQTADLLVTQHWLRDRVWQLSFFHGFTHEESSVSELRVSFPIDLGNEALSICRKLAMSSCESNGIGWAEKIYDIAHSIVSILRVFPALGSDSDSPTTNFQLTRPIPVTETLHHLLAILTTFRAGQNPYVAMLRSDMASLSAAIPALSA
ncbi:hypothetical protein T439DRAFT_325924 [Meredithblackwellia eburnea MCA 4105]